MEQLDMIPPEQKGEAYFSKCGLYRYTLNRHIHERAGRCVFIMLNPSTATAETDDPTTRRCVRFAHDWGYGSYRAVNLFAYRSADPKKIRVISDPVGPENDAQIILGCSDAELIVAAWGTHGTFLGRDKAVMKILAAEKLSVHCLGLTKHGHPQFPLYLKKELKPIIFNPDSQ